MPTAAHPPHAAATQALFDFLDGTHRRMQHELRQMNVLVDALVHERLQPADRAQLTDTVHWFDTVAREHHLDEEKHVFPTLLVSGDAQVVETTRRLRQDHGWIEQNWLEIGPLLSAVANGNHWFEAEQLQRAVRLFTDLCLDHLVLEESLAYHAARAHIDAATLAAADREMAQRRQARQARHEASAKTGRQGRR